MIQLQFLNYVIKNNDMTLVTLNNLNQDYFSGYRDEFNFICDFYKKYNKAPDIETFVNKFKDFDVIDVKETPRYLIDELFKDYQTQQLAKTFNKVREKLLDGKLEDAVNLYNSAYNKLQKSVSLNAVDLIKDTSRYNTYVDKIGNFDKYFVRTGFYELDNIIGGWDRQEDLITIVARPGVGKSWLGLKFAIAAAEQGLNVGIYSGEMSENSVGYRVDTLIGHFSNGALIHGGASIKDDYKTYIDNLPNTIKGSIKVITPKTLGGYADISTLRAFIEKYNLELLLVDQYSLLEDQKKGKSTSEKTYNLSTDLTNLQAVMRIPIIAISQQNRETTEDGSKDTSLIAQSDKIGQDSTVVLFFSRDKDDKSILNIDLVKARNNPAGKQLKYLVDFNKGDFTFIPSADDTMVNEQYENRYDNTEEEVF